MNIKEVEKKIDDFKNRIIKTFGENIECILLTGSYSRDDYHYKSDIDLWIFFKEIRLEYLEKVGQIVTRTGNRPEINPQCTTFKEVSSLSFSYQFNPIQFLLDGKIIYGELNLVPPTKKDILLEIGKLCVFVLMSARHYITVEENEALLINEKLQKWVLKPLVWAIRYEAYFQDDKLLRTKADIDNYEFSEDKREIIKDYYELVRNEYNGTSKRVLQNAGKVSMTMINSVEEVLMLEYCERKPEPEVVKIDIEKWQKELGLELFGKVVVLLSALNKLWALWDLMYLTNKYDKKMITARSSRNRTSAVTLSVGLLQELYEVLTVINKDIDKEGKVHNKIKEILAVFDSNKLRSLLTDYRDDISFHIGKRSLGFDITNIAQGINDFIKYDSSIQRDVYYHFSDEVINRAFFFKKDADVIRHIETDIKGFEDIYTKRLSSFLDYIYKVHTKVIKDGGVLVTYIMDEFNLRETETSHQ